jgi:hypothetical protein
MNPALQLGWSLRFLAAFAPWRLLLVVCHLGLDDFGEAAEGVVAVLLVNANEGALVQHAIGTPDVVAAGDGAALVDGGDDGFGVAAVLLAVGSAPAAPEALTQ